LIRPPKLEQQGRYFDGDQGLRLVVDVALNVNAQVLVLSHPDLPGGRQNWPFDAIRALADQARRDQLVISLRADASDDSALIETARLAIEDAEVIAQLKQHCAHLEKRDMPRGIGRRIVTSVGVAVVAVVAMIFVILPAMANTLANYIPIEREVAYGKTVVRQIERMLGNSKPDGLTCKNPKGLAALEVMTDRLTQGAGLEYDLNILVFNHPMVNAFAAPGGQVVIMRGLLQKAEDADEVAAVLGHEIGHVEARDTTRNALRTAGSAGLLSLVLGDFVGGSGVLIVAEYTLNAAYTRDAEAKADVFALNMLDASQAILTQPLAPNGRAPLPRGRARRRPC